MKVIALRVPPHHEWYYMKFPQQRRRLLIKADHIKITAGISPPNNLQLFLLLQLNHADA